LTEETDNIENKKKKKSWILIFLKWISLGLFAFLFFITITLISINTFEFIRKPVINTVVNLINKSLIAKIEIGDLKFVSHNTVWMKDFRLITANDTLAAINELKVKVSISGFLNNKVIIRYLQIKSPKIKLLRSQIDEKWNFEKISPPSKPSTEKGSTPIIKIQVLDIKNGIFVLCDSTYKSDLPFNPLNLNLQNLNINLNLNIDVDNNEYLTKINKLSFYEENTNFEVDSMTFEASLDSTKVQLNNFFVKTGDNEITINTKILNYSPLSKEKYNNFDSARFILNAEIIKFNTSTLKKFIWVPFNDSILADLKLNATGSTKNLFFDELKLNMLNSQLNSTGSLLNFNTEDIVYKFSFVDTEIYEDDIKSLLDIDLESIPNFNKANIIALQAIGDIHKVNTDLDIYSDIGALKGKVFFNYSPSIKYKADIKFDSLDFAPILQNTQLSSSLFGNLSIEGIGVNPKNMIVKTNLDIISSSFAGRNIEKLSANVNMDKGIVDILNVDFEFPSNNINAEFANSKSLLSINGELNIYDFKHPKYNIFCNLQGINLARLLENEDFPRRVTSEISLKGDGSNIDSMNLNFNAKIENAIFKDFGLMPLNVNVEVNTTDDKNNKILLKLGEDYIDFTGKYKPSEFMTSLNNWIEYASVFFESRYEQFIKKEFDTEKEKKLQFLSTSSQFPTADAKIDLKFSNFHLLNLVVPNFSILTSIYTNSSIYSDSTNFIADFTSFEIGNTLINASENKIQFDKFNFSGILSLKKQDSLMNLSYLNISLDDLESIQFNNISLNKPVSDIFIADSNFIIDLSVDYDTLAKASIGLNGQINRDFISINLDKLNLSFIDKFLIRNAEIGKIEISSTMFKIDKLNFFGMNDEKISIIGIADTNSFHDVTLDIQNIKLKNFLNLMPENLRTMFNDVDFHLNEAKLEIEGDYENPVFKFKLNVDKILMQNQQIGSLISDLGYNNKNISGNISLLNENYGELPPLELELIKLPVDLSLNQNFAKMGKGYLANIAMDSLNLKIIEPWQPFIKNIGGFASANIDLSGTNEKDYSLKGNIEINNFTFRSMNNYLKYNTDAKISLDNQSIFVDTLHIINFGSKTYASIKGNVDFNENELGYFDFGIQAKDFLLLDEVSKLVNPQIYGKLSVSTREGGIQVNGTPDNVNILGELQVNPSSLNIAGMGGSNSITKTNFNYEIKGDSRVYTILTATDSSDTITEQPKTNKTSFVPDIKMNVYIPKSVQLKIDLGAIGEIVAILGTSDPTIPMRYVMDDKNPQGELFGELIIKQGSTLNSYKKMKATGTIAFSTGKLNEPNLNLVAQYEGKMDEETNPIKYSVYIYITGNPSNLKVRFDYTLNNMAPQGEQKKIEENALYLLLFGTLPGRADILDPTVVNKLGSAGISSIASRSMSDLLLKTGVIESADVELNSEDFEKSKIQLKGKLFGSLNWSFGGNVADFTKNNQIVIEIPMDVDSKVFNQFIWLISYSTNLNSTIIDPDEKNWEVKFKIGASW